MAVNRIRDKAETFDLGALRLFRDDLEDIAEAVSELGALIIECDDTFIASTRDDFADLPGDMGALSIAGVADDGRAVKVDLSKTTASVTVLKADTLCRGVVGGVQAICRRPGRRRVRWPTLKFQGLLAPIKFAPPVVRLVNSYYVDHPSFWRRTKDDWAVEIIVGAVFLGLGFVLGKYFG
ncbi:hypothetical protein [Streptosporangium sp. KLBMP 9127]|nr:hypothetical protein [Streptosporangium sp. KLBMP 9127]